MKRLLEKEIRDLAPAAFVAVSAATLVGILDLLYNWDRNRMAGLSLWFCVVGACLIALLGGAHALGRETRAHLVLLSIWPVSRWRLWAAKLLGSLMMVAATIGLSFILCGGLLTVRGYSVPKLYADLEIFPFGKALLAYVALYCFGFALSVLIRMTLAAAGAALMLMELTVGAALFILFDFMWARWGQYIGWYPDMLPRVWRGVWAVSSVLWPSLLAVAASGWAFVRLPVLESWRRSLSALGIYVAAIVLGVATVEIGGVMLTRPRLTATYLEASVDPAGRQIALSSSGTRGLWIMDTEGRGRRLILGGPAHATEFSPDGRRLRFNLLCLIWIGNLQTGKLWRIDYDLRLQPIWSPKGSYLVLEGDRHYAFTDGSGTIIELPEHPRMTWVSGWSPDERRIYGESTTRRPETVTYLEFTLPALTERTIARVSGDASLSHLSPDGHWIASYLRRTVPGSTDTVPVLLLVESATGHTHTLTGWETNLEPWSSEGRYLWLHREVPYTVASDDSTQWAIFDTHVMRIVRRFTGRDLPALSMKHRQIHMGGGRVCIGASDRPAEADGMHYWRADEDGGNVHYLGRKTGRIVGWAHNGDIIMQRGTPEVYKLPPGALVTATLVRVNPQTGAERVIFQLTSPRD